jgi:hypothetical protein
VELYILESFPVSQLILEFHFIASEIKEALVELLLGLW